MRTIALVVGLVSLSANILVAANPALVAQGRKRIEGLAIIARAPAPDKFGYATTRYRIIEGKSQDLGEAIQWWNEKVYTSSHDHAGGFLPEGYLTGDAAEMAANKTWWARSRKADEGRDKWIDYRVAGKVLQVLTDALLVDHYQGSPIILKNHPDQSKLVDGDGIDVIAVPVGRTNYVNTIGSRSTVKLYDFGTVKK